MSTIIILAYIQYEIFPLRSSEKPIDAIYSHAGGGSVSAGYDFIT